MFVPKNSNNRGTKINMKIVKYTKRDSHLGFLGSKTMYLFTGGSKIFQNSEIKIFNDILGSTQAEQENKG